MYTALCMTMILDSEKLIPQYNQNSVLTMSWIAWGSQTPPGYGPAAGHVAHLFARITT